VSHQAGSPRHASRFEATLAARAGLTAVRADVLVGSAVLHGAAVALFVYWLPAPALERPHADAPHVELVAPQPALVDVVVLDSPSDVHAAVYRPGAAGAHRQLAASPQASAGETGTGHEPAGREPTAGGGLMHMRGADLALAPDVADRIAAGGAELHEPAHRSGKLENVSGGGGVIHDRVTTVTVERDGTAHFHDKPYIDVHLHVPIPHIDVKQDLHDLGDMLQDWYRDPEAGTRYGTTSELSEAAKAVPGSCDVWGDPMCDDPLAPESEKRARQRSDKSVSLFGNADLTGWLYHRYAHADPYSSRKAKLLDDTRAERIERGEAFRAEQAARSAELMQRSLEELWAREADPAARRRALYELWSDCADDEAGARARAMVIGWVRAKLPAGSVDAYTGAELAAMAPFAPYAP